MSPIEFPVDVAHEPGRTRYRFVAELPLLWTERLAGGLAALGEDIAELVAVHRDGVWDVDLSVRGRPSLDLAHLLRQAEDRAASVGHHWLDRFELERATEGALQLDVRAPDRAGFLAFLLRELRTLALFPSHVIAKSAGLSVVDRFALVSVGGAAPSEGTARALHAVLLGHIRPAPTAARSWG
ncbi:MAG: hypothetical protein H6725_06955 [Sandaracinaceae bacterium]|nr:hypothetical protein [Sandaracinaceae bacterium]